MKKLAAGGAVAIAVLCAAAINASAAQTSGHSPGYAPLENFVGRWTTKGSEASFLEVCTWYDGQFHVVCNSESKRPDGSTGRGMSILSYLPGQGYVYTGIGSKGRYETLQGGTWSGGLFTFTSTATEGGKQVATRIKIGPFTEQGFLFVVETSTDDADWTEADVATYIKLK